MFFVIVRRNYSLRDISWKHIVRLNYSLHDISWKRIVIPYGSGEGNVNDDLKFVGSFA